MNISRFKDLRWATTLMLWSCQGARARERSVTMNGRHAKIFLSASYVDLVALLGTGDAISRAELEIASHAW